jgi:hypothetical protein
MVEARCSKRRSPGGLGHQVQIAGIGGVAAQPERLALPGRRHLPRRGILQGRDECAAVRWRYLQRHFDQPGVDRRKRQFFGRKNAGGAWPPPVAAGQGLSRGLSQGLGREYRSCQHCRHGNEEFHIVFPCAADANTRDHRDKIAWSVTQNQGACRRRSNRKPARMKKVFQQVIFKPECGDRSEPVTGPPREQNEDRDQSRGDQHPVLAFKTEKYKTLDEKLHRSRPQFWAE